MAGLLVFARKFSSDRSGAIAVIFVLVFIVLILLIGIAVDLGRAQNASAMIANSIDSVALAAAKGMTEDDMTDAEVVTLVNQYISTQATSGELLGSKYSNLVTTINHKDGTIKIDVDVNVPTTFTSITNTEMIVVHKTTTASYKVKAIELAMVLDTTGSMNDNNKINDLKVAAKAVVDVLMQPGKPQINRIALAPYSASIRVTPYSSAVSGGASADCVVERSGGDAFTDISGSSSAVGTSDAATNNRYSCPGQTIMPLSKDPLPLKTAIDSYVAGGGTAGQVGLAWGWYQISPEWKNVWPKISKPKNYVDPNNVKAILLMTDGMFNTAYFNGPVATDADQEVTSQAQTTALCDAIKAKGITIYAVGFDLASNPPPGDVTGPLLLTGCASDDGKGGKEYYSADNGADLLAAFTKIADKLAVLRLTE
jgi:Flp pilus assembly protein TadG